MKKVNFFIQHLRDYAECDLNYHCPHCGRPLFECNDKPCRYRGKVHTQCMCGHIISFGWTPFGNSVQMEIPYDENFTKYLYILVIKSYLIQFSYHKFKRFY